MRITPLDPWICRKISASRSTVSRQEIEAWQLRKLNETLAWAREKSSFYRDFFAGMPVSIGSLDELCQFPFTTPEDVRRNPLSFVCVSQDEIRRVVTLQTSGTTGVPKRLFFTADDQELTIDFFGVGMSTLTVPGERVLILLPCKTPGSVGDLLRIGLSRLGMEPIPYGPVCDPLHALEIINIERADCLVGSPTQVLGLARRWRHGMYRPRSVLLSTDYVPASIVKILREVWDCDVYNHYGTTEMGLGGGVECAAHRGYHLREADLFFEVIHSVTGEPVRDGDYGEVVFTTLTRRGMPLIRYRMDDRSRFLPGDCPCDTQLKTLERVSGRISGFVPVGDEVLRLSDFDEALFSIPGLLNFSVTLSGEKGNEVLLVETHMLTAEDTTSLVKKALETLRSIRHMEVIVNCKHSPGETGSIIKRIIEDKRGEYA